MIIRLPSGYSSEKTFLHACMVNHQLRVYAETGKPEDKPFVFEPSGPTVKEGIHTPAWDGITPAMEPKVATPIQHMLDHVRFELTEACKAAERSAESLPGEASDRMAIEMYGQARVDTARALIAMLQDKALSETLLCASILLEAQ